MPRKKFRMPRPVFRAEALLSENTRIPLIRCTYGRNTSVLTLKEAVEYLDEHRNAVGSPIWVELYAAVEKTMRYLKKANITR